MRTWKIFAQPWNREYGLYVHDFGVETKDCKMATDLVWTNVSPFAEVSAPSPMCLTGEQAQVLADSLWDANIRPNGAKGSAGQLVAVEKHLLDMRTIAFHKLEIAQARASDA